MMKIIEFLWEEDSELLCVKCEVEKIEVNFNFSKKTIEDRIVHKREDIIAHREEGVTIGQWKTLVEDRIKKLLESDEDFRNDLLKTLKKELSKKISI
jgi:hypothetical protein